jgi:hypothetical protein
MMLLVRIRLIDKQIAVRKRLVVVRVNYDFVGDGGRLALVAMDFTCSSTRPPFLSY